MPYSAPPTLTRRALLSLGGGLLGLAGSHFLIACGETASTQVAAVPTLSATVAATATTLLSPGATIAITTATITPPAIPTSTLATTSATPVTVTATASPSLQPGTPVAPTAATLPPFDGIPQGRTPDGFPALGNPDAAVTMIDYSDFL